MNKNYKDSLDRSFEPDDMKSDLYGAYSITGLGEVFLWCGTGRKHPVCMYRLLIPNYAQLEGDEKVFAEDKVTFLFTRSEILLLLEYLTRYETFGDRHIVVRAEDPSFQQLRLRAWNCEIFDLDADDDWFNPFQVGGIQVPSVSLDLALN